MRGPGFETPRGQPRETGRGLHPHGKAREYDVQRKEPRTVRPQAEVNSYEVRLGGDGRPPEYGAPYGLVAQDKKQPPLPRSKEMYPYAKPQRSADPQSEQRTAPPYDFAHNRSVGTRPVKYDLGQFEPRGSGGSTQNGRSNHAPRVKQEARWRNPPYQPHYVRDNKASPRSYERNGHYDPSSVPGGQRMAPDQRYGSISGQHWPPERTGYTINDYLKDSYMYSGGVDL